MVTKMVRSAERMTIQAVEDEVLTTAHGLAVALHLAGAMDMVGMRDMDRLCLSPRPNYSGSEVKRIRAATRMSQPVFARLLGVNKSAVAQWERGVRHPSGPALRLLELLDPDKPDSPIVQVRRDMTESVA